MAPRKCKGELALEKKTQAILAAMEVAINYEFEVDRLIRKSCRHWKLR
jgi:hypothetical protein